MTTNRQSGPSVTRQDACSSSPTARCSRARQSAPTRRRSRHRRGRVQHGAVRLPGGHHRPVVRRADHHVHLSAHRQLRRHRRGRREPPAVLPRHRRARPGPPAVELAGAGRRPRQLPAPPRRRRHHRGRHPSPHPAHPRGRVDAVRVRHGRRAHAQGGGERRAGHRRRRPRRDGHHDRAVHRRHGPVPSRRLRLRHQDARSCVTSPASPPSRSCPASTSAAEVLARQPDGVFLSNGPGDPAAVPYAARRHRRPRRRGAGVRHLPRPPAARRWRSAARPTSSRSAITAATTPCAGSPPARSRSPARTTTTRSPRARSPTADVTHVNLNDGVIEGVRHAGRARVQRAVPPRGRTRARTTPATCSRSSRLLMDSEVADAPPHRHPLDPAHRLGPIVIGQACEFDYSGTQACRVLREEGYRVILANSNPATIMTDPEFADRTYIEPSTSMCSPRSASVSGPTRCCRRSAARPR